MQIRTVALPVCGRTTHSFLRRLHVWINGSADFQFFSGTVCLGLAIQAGNRLFDLSPLVNI